MSSYFRTVPAIPIEEEASKSSGTAKRFKDKAAYLLGAKMFGADPFWGEVVGYISDGVSLTKEIFSRILEKLKTFFSDTADALVATAQALTAFIALVWDQFKKKTAACLYWVGETFGIVNPEFAKSKEKELRKAYTDSQRSNMQRWDDSYDDSYDDNGFLKKNPHMATAFIAGVNSVNDFENEFENAIAQAGEEKSDMPEKVQVGFLAWIATLISSFTSAIEGINFDLVSLEGLFSKFTRTLTQITIVEKFDMRTRLKKLCDAIYAYFTGSHLFDDIATLNRTDKIFKEVASLVKSMGEQKNPSPREMARLRYLVKTYDNDMAVCFSAFPLKQPRFVVEQRQFRAMIGKYNSHIHSGQERIKPVSVVIRGPSGVGKSYVEKQLAIDVPDLLHRMMKARKDKVERAKFREYMSELVDRPSRYTVNCLGEKHEYDDGYGDPVFYCLQEFGSTESREESVKWTSHLMSVMDTQPLLLNTAFGDKGTRFFDSPFIVATGNFGEIPCGVNDKTAVYRRIDFDLAIVAPRSAAGKAVSVTLDNIRFTMSKEMKAVFAKNFRPHTMCHKQLGEDMSKWPLVITYSQLVQMVAGVYIERRASSRQLNAVSDVPLFEIDLDLIDTFDEDLLYNEDAKDKGKEKDKVVKPMFLDDSDSDTDCSVKQCGACDTKTDFKIKLAHFIMEMASLPQAAMPVEMLEGYYEQMLCIIDKYFVVDRTASGDDKNPYAEYDDIMSFVAHLDALVQKAKLDKNKVRFALKLVTGLRMRVCNQIKILGGRSFSFFESKEKMKPFGSVKVREAYIQATSVQRAFYRINFPEMKFGRTKEEELRNIHFANTRSAWLLKRQAKNLKRRMRQREKKAAATAGKTEWATRDKRKRYQDEEDDFLSSGEESDGDPRAKAELDDYEGQRRDYEERFENYDGYTNDWEMQLAEDRKRYLEQGYQDRPDGWLGYDENYDDHEDNQERIDESNYRLQGYTEKDPNDSHKKHMYNCLNGSYSWRQAVVSKFTGENPAYIAALDEAEKSPDPYALTYLVWHMFDVTRGKAPSMDEHFEDLISFGTTMNRAQAEFMLREGSLMIDFFQYWTRLHVNTDDYLYYGHCLKLALKETVHLTRRGSAVMAAYVATLPQDFQAIFKRNFVEVQPFNWTALWSLITSFVSIAFVASIIGISVHMCVTRHKIMESEFAYMTAIEKAKALETFAVLAEEAGVQVASRDTTGAAQKFAKQKNIVEKYDAKTTAQAGFQDAAFRLKIQNNMVIIANTNTGSKLSHGLFVHGGLLLMNKHVFESFELFTLLPFNTIRKKRIVRKCDMVIAKDLGDDKIVLALTEVAAYPNVVKHMCSRSDYDVHPVTAGAMCTFDTEYLQPVVDPVSEINYRKRKINCNGAGITPMYIDTSYCYSWDGAKTGACGSMLTGKVNGSNALVGMHIAGYEANHFGISTALFKEDFSFVTDHLASWATTGASLAIKTKTDDYSTLQGRIETNDKFSVTNGTVFTPTPFKTVGFQGLNVGSPAVLTMEAYRLARIKEATQSAKSYHARVDVINVAKEYSEQIGNLLNDVCDEKTRLCRTLPLKAALYAHDALGPIVFSTSNGARNDRLKIKKSHMQDETSKDAEIFFKEIQKVEDHFTRTGECVAQITRDCEKDEIRDEERVSLKKTRIFNIADSHDNSRQRMYLGDLVGRQKSFFFFSPGMCGLNPATFMWSMIYEMFVGGNVVFSDISGFDYTCGLWVMYILGPWLRRAYGHNAQAFIRAIWAIKSCMCAIRFGPERLGTDPVTGAPIIGFRGRILEGGNSTGNWLTTVLNTWMNTCYHAILVIVGSIMNGDNPLLNLFKLKLILYSDDNISRLDALWWNANFVGTFFEKLFGITATGVDKGELKQDLVTIEDAEFLCRRFVKRGGIVYAPLDKMSLMTQLFYVKCPRKLRGTPFVMQQLQINVCNVARELVEYPPEEAFALIAEIREFCSVNDIPVDIPAYDYGNVELKMSTM